MSDLEKLQDEAIALIKNKKVNKNMDQAPKEPKAPKTIKVSTVIISVIVILALIGSFIGGIAYKSYDQNRITSEAAALVQTLKSQK